MTTEYLRFLPDPVNLTLRQNQRWTVNFAYLNPDGSTIDLTGYNPLLTFRTTAQSRQEVLAMGTSADSGITFNPTTNPQVMIDGVIACDPGRYEYDLALYETFNGNPSVALFLAVGTVTVEGAVTRND
jgi:hypothetical protein